ncbi:hypothetical protein HYC85_020053 [Camellia sinensis]|uniref:Uncharacterized protein n=1 Tax=Camellia sinensis TaxID=4442 RepID=A0A7J7GR71_CAMSI|nr:hypothetical protein HYC85_020053 [Camellia sinensis]
MHPTLDVNPCTQKLDMNPCTQHVPNNIFNLNPCTLGMNPCTQHSFKFEVVQKSKLRDG